MHVFMQFVAASKRNSHVQNAKHRIRAEVSSALGHYPHKPHIHQHFHGSHWHSGQRVHRLDGYHSNRWSGRRHSTVRHHFTGWSAWSNCGNNCIKRRERYCKVKRKCGHTKQVEEHKCWSCHPEPVWQPSTHHEPPQQQQQQTIHHGNDLPSTIVINAAAAAATAPQQLPVLYDITTTLKPQYHWQPHVIVEEVEEEEESDEHDNANYATHAPPWKVVGEDEEEEDEGLEPTDASDDFYVLNTRPRYKKQRKQVVFDANKEYDDDEFDDYISETAEEGVLPARALQTRYERRKQLRQRKRERVGAKQRKLLHGDDGIEGDTFQYEDFDFDPESNRGFESHYSDSYEESDYAEQTRNGSFLLGPSKEKATPDALIPRHRRVYSKWSRWTKCSPKCTTRRYKKCRIKEHCGREVLREIAYCYTEGSFCQQWLQAQIQKTPPYELRPVAARRRDIGSEGTQSNSIVSDYIMNGKGYRGPEYTPVKMKCGIASIRSNKRNLYNMLKIIGGKAARKGEWPWQVAIFNRYKEAFCGGTLIAPQWVLTAAHCVRKVLYVRIGEHNLDYEDSTELQLRVLKSFKHPNFDKKTVDSDVALLRLPKPVNATTWIGYSCLPRPYQPLPKNVDCTVIGWGKRRNRDIAGTSVLHQAEVPIIPMDNCRSVYHDYTITKNMFCAGHKRGRIDTCAGDSGGPLLCRDTTKPNHPWTIFGITSFGDGCAKRNKFGIYAKVPNYVDWVWSVINCNGNCKMHQRSFGN